MSTGSLDRWKGLPEIHVTRSVQSSLDPCWSKKLRKQRLNAGQISNSGGEFMFRDLGERIEIGGCDVAYLMGEISI
jgi:hypothetical protein